MKKENTNLMYQTQQTNDNSNNVLTKEPRKEVLSKKVKAVISAMLAVKDRPIQNYSDHISNELNLNYTYLANVFSEHEGRTIEGYIIDKKIEKATDMLLYGNYTISQIADLLHYSSIGHFSNQFKKLKGVSPSEFKKNNGKMFV